ncbi:Deleted in lung and esophageal cancer protein 1 [Cichlidogyrus casuarinus]|uniref:Deleted in lung and esophageal cancer protein 1 n=1 Tax=Cichlidogyrus casuarinus TaxID=1844966 RepID=A0ABD2Q3I4_9PLAT
MFGVVTKYNTKLKLILPHFKAKLYHAAFGVLGFLAISLAFCLGLYSSWFQDRLAELLADSAGQYLASFLLLVVICPRRLVVVNPTDLDLSLEWVLRTCIKNPLNDRQSKMSEEIFKIEPPKVRIGARERIECSLHFGPLELGEFSAIFQGLVTPTQDDEDDWSVEFEPTENSSPVALELECRAQAHPIDITLETREVIFTEPLLVDTPTRRRVLMINKNHLFPLPFSWQVEDSSSNNFWVQSVALELYVSSPNTGKFKRRLICVTEVETVEPVSMSVEAGFRGAELCISECCLDFGMMRLGELKTVRFLLENRDPVPCKWRLELPSLGDGVNLEIKPTEGVITGLNSVKISAKLSIAQIMNLHEQIVFRTEANALSTMQITAVVHPSRVTCSVSQLVVENFFRRIPFNVHFFLVNEAFHEAQVDFISVGT